MQTSRFRVESDAITYIWHPQAAGSVFQPVQSLDEILEDIAGTGRGQLFFEELSSE